MSGRGAQRGRTLRGAYGPVGMLVMSVMGLAVAVYLTTVHYASVPLVCSTNGVIDCSAVTRSAYSVVPGTSLPITVPGMAWFAVSGWLAALAVWRRHSEPAWLRPAHLLWALLGLGTALYLVFVEVVRLHRLCEWCTAIHVLILLTFLCVLGRLQT